MRPGLALLVVPCTLGLAAPPTARGGAPDAPEPVLAEPEITARVEQSARRGCQWLVRNQNRDGSQKSAYAVASSALAGLAWLGSGSTFDTGPYATNLRRCLEYLLRSQGRGGFISESAGYGNSSMYGHGFAAQFLAEAYGMVREEELEQRVREALVKATHLIESTQNQFGGWNGTPDARQTDDGSGAVAIMQITALRAAESVGIQVKTQVVEKARKYLLEMTNVEGWYAYNWHARGMNQSPGTTGPGIYMLGAMNLQNNPKYHKGIRNLMSSCPFLSGARRDAGTWYWFYYTCFYASLAIYQHGGAEWGRWYPAMVKALLDRQNSDGSFDDQFGGVYTAFAVLSLEIPYRYLPMFQEGGAGREGR